MSRHDLLPLLLLFQWHASVICSFLLLNFSLLVLLVGFASEPGRK